MSYPWSVASIPYHSQNLNAPCLLITNSYFYVGTWTLKQYCISTKIHLTLWLGISTVNAHIFNSLSIVHTRQFLYTLLMASLCSFLSFWTAQKVCVLHYQFSAPFYDACSVFRSQNFCKVIGEAGKRSMLCQHTTWTTRKIYFPGSGLSYSLVRSVGKESL